MTILLGCEQSELGEALPVIALTITSLCKLCVSCKGHLPSSVPPRKSSRPPLVQICHGAPGLLFLLGYARRSKYLVPNYWEPVWDEAIRDSSERIWSEGILSKGGGLCHGIAGNAWPFLTLHDTFEYHKEIITQSRQAYQNRTNMTPGDEILSGDYFLSRALALLRCAQITQPFDQGSSGNQFRLPDSPFSLFEGLAGTDCAWSEACVAIKTRLRKEEVDDAAQDISAFERDNQFLSNSRHILGIPGLSVHGIL